MGPTHAVHLETEHKIAGVPVPRPGYCATSTAGTMQVLQSQQSLLVLITRSTLAVAFSPPRVAKSRVPCSAVHSALPHWQQRCGRRASGSVCWARGMCFVDHRAKCFFLIFFFF